LTRQRQHELPDHQALIRVLDLGELIAVEVDRHSVATPTRDAPDEIGW
jgi:hypothetical protein